MKSTHSLIRSLFLVLISILSYTNIDAQILVSGTDFDPLPGNASRFYIGLPDVAQIGLQSGSISSTAPIATNVNPNVFNAGYFYAITPTPIRLDSVRYQDFAVTDYSYVYSPLTAAPNVNILTYSLTNLVPNSAVSVIVDYCSAVKSTYAGCTGQRNEFKAGINLDQYNLLNGTDATQIGMGACDSKTFTGTVDASGNMVFRMNATQAGSCKAMAIKKIQIMGTPQPKIISNEGTEVCAGEQITLQTTTKYNATYQWQVNTTGTWTNVTVGGTNQSLLYEVPTVQTYQFRCLVTPLPSGTAITTNVVSVSAITCCVEAGVAASRKTIYYDDFGTVDLTDVSGQTYKVWDYTNVLNPVLVTKTTTTPFRWPLVPSPLGATFQATGPLQDGQYTVAGYLTGYNPDNGYQGAKLEWANRIGGTDPSPQPALDHSGTKAGAALFINCPTGTFGQSLYKRTISNLCFGKQLSFECWINVFTDGPGPGCSAYAPVNVQIKLTDGNNAANFVTASATATRASSGGGVWVRVSGNITLGAGSTSVIMDVINNSTESTCGNDLVLDDIKIMACSPPPLNVYFDIPTLATTKNVCTAALNLDVKPSALLSAYYGNSPQYLYQWSKTPADYTSWKNLAVPQAGVTYTIANPSLDPAFAGTVNGDKIYFRVVATTAAVFAANNNFTAPKYANDNDPCKNYSVSDAIESTVQCPSCSKPSAVTITVPSTTPKAICEGTAQTLTGSATVPAASLNGGFTYSWIKTVGTGAGVKVAPTIFAIPTTTATPMPSYTGITGLIADAGTYVLRVEDGSTGNSSCYTEATVVITVNPKPTISSAATGSVCSGVAQAYTITSVVPSSYAWTRAVVAGITPATIGSGATASIAETLTNTTLAPVVVRYIITPTSTAGSCPGPAFNYDVTVNPKPAITSAITGSVCSGIAQAYTITSNVASSYAWTRASVANITPGTGSGTSASITEALTNSTAAAINVIYKITPTSTTGTCAGSVFDYTVTVNPAPTISSATSGSICSGTAQSYDITSVVPSSYSWSRAAVTGVTNAAVTAQTADPITETLTLTAGSTAARTVVYKITPTATTGSCVGPVFDYTVTVNPLPIINSAATGSICSGVAQSYDITSVVPSSYTWSRVAVAGVSNAAATGQTADPITETLTLDAGVITSRVVRYVITPTSTTGTCLGAAFNYDVTINPKPTITSAATGTTCTAVALNYLITSDVASTYSWTRAAAAGVTPVPGAASTANPITETLSSSSDVDVVYTIIPTSTAGSCPGPAFTYTVRISATAVPTVAITTTPGTTICANTPVTFTTTVTSGGTPTYEWFVNNTSQGAASAAAGSEKFSSSTLTTGAVVKVEITSSLGCAVPKKADASVTMTVTPIPVPSVALAADKTTICPADNVIFTATPTEGGAGPIYVWKNNNVVIPSSGSGATFTTTGTLLGSPNSVTVEMVSNKLCAPTTPVASSPVVITVNPTLVPTVTLTGAPLTVCSGQSVTFTAAVTNEGAAPSYLWKINGASPGVTTSIPSYSTAALTSSTDEVTVELTSNALCANPTKVTSNKVTTTILPGIGAGTIAADQTICYNTAPNPITQVTAATGVTAAVVYTWESSLDGTLYNSIAPTGPGLTVPALTVTTWYRRIATDATLPAPCNTATSNAIKITVSTDVTAGVIAGNEITCASKPTTATTSTSLPTGGQGTFTYEWESSTTAASGPFGPASPTGAGTTYTPGSLTTTTYYRRKEINSCKTVYSNVITKTVTPNTVVSVTTNSPLQTCVGTAITFTATPTGGGGTPTYAWTKGGVAVTGNTTNTYTFTPVIGDNGKQVIVTLTSSDACNTGVASSTPVVLDIVNAQTPTVSITTLNNPNCAGMLSTFTATATGTGSAPTYQWYVNTPAGSGTTDPSDVKINRFSTASLVDGDEVWVEMTSSLTCVLGPNPVASNKIKMQIKSVPNPVITNPVGQVCSGKTFTFNATVGTGTGIKYQWKRGGVAIQGATNSTYEADQSGTYTITEDNGTCNQTSQPGTLDIIQTPDAYAGEDIYIKAGDQGRLQGSGGALYSWTPSTGLSDANVSNPTFLADYTIEYTVVVSDPLNLCHDDDQVIVYVARPIRIPNVITVNGDGSNDTWEIENIESYPAAEFLIYNRWGNLVWKSDGYPKKWDGTNFRNGEVLPDGTYFYIINLNSPIYTEPYTGWIQIVK